MPRGRERPNGAASGVATWTPRGRTKNKKFQNKFKFHSDSNSEHSFREMPWPKAIKHRKWMKAASFHYLAPPTRSWTHLNSFKTPDSLASHLHNFKTQQKFHEKNRRKNLFSARLKGPKKNKKKNMAAILIGTPGGRLPGAQVSWLPATTLERFSFLKKESNAEKQFEEKSFKRWPFFFSHSPTWRGGRGTEMSRVHAGQPLRCVKQIPSPTCLFNFCFGPAHKRKKLIGLTGWRQWTHFHPPKTEKLRQWIGFNTLRENATHLNIQICHWRKQLLENSEKMMTLFLNSLNNIWRFFQIFEVTFYEF